MIVAMAAMVMANVIINFAFFVNNIIIITIIMDRYIFKYFFIIITIIMDTIIGAIRNAIIIMNRQVK